MYVHAAGNNPVVLDHYCVSAFLELYRVEALHALDKLSPPAMQSC